MVMISSLGTTKEDAMKALVMMMTLLVASVYGFDVVDRAVSLIDQARSSVSAVDTSNPARISKEYTVVELFRAETANDLETAVANGYPMPWLAEVLSDESIPEEDRYWLDCRIRAATAQDLHLFFDRSGNPTHVDAAYIGPGEDYWREHLMVSPVGARDLPEENRPTRPVGGRGYILDVFGDRVGELAEVSSSESLDRDATIAVTPSGGSTMLNWQEAFACFMYPNGSFREVPFDYVAVFDATVSPNGEVVVFRCRTSTGTGFDPVTHEALTGDIGDAYIFDSRGNLLQRVTPPSLFRAIAAQISSDGRYICSYLSTGELFLIDCEDGYSTRLIEEYEGSRSSRGHYSFSPDGGYLCAGGFSPGIIISLDPYSVVWQRDYNQERRDYTRVNCSNEAEWIAITTTYGDVPENYRYEMEVLQDNQLIYSSTSEGRYNEETVVSPNGHFLLTRQSDQAIGNTCIPTVIRQIRRKGSE
jgi:hypothetical protein